MARSFVRIVVGLLVLVAFLSIVLTSLPSQTSITFAPIESVASGVGGGGGGAAEGVSKRHSAPLSSSGVGGSSAVEGSNKRPLRGPATVSASSVSPASPSSKPFHDVVLIDGRERCEHLIPYVNDILGDRTFGGLIVIMVFWADEMDVCKRIFQPVLATRLTVFFAGGSGLTPYLYEQSLTIYYGALAFIEANRLEMIGAGSQHQPVRIAALRPDEVNWCRSPMDSIPHNNSGESDYVYFTYVHNGGFAHDNQEFPQNPWSHGRGGQQHRFVGLPSPNDAIPVDHFFGGSPRAVAKFARNVLALSKGSFARLSMNHFGHPSLKDMVKPFAAESGGGGAFSPAFVHANCHYYLKPSEENAARTGDASATSASASSASNSEPVRPMPSFEGSPRCLPEHKIVIGTRLCRRLSSDKAPTPEAGNASSSVDVVISPGIIPLTESQKVAAVVGTTPMCRHPYHWAVNEVPSNTSLAGTAKAHLVQGAAAVKQRGLFATPPKAQPRTAGEGEAPREYPDYYADQTARCPKGKLGIMTMMAGYTVSKVEMLLASFLAFADPHCATLISFVHPGLGFEALSNRFPGRFEIVFMDGNSPYMRNRRLLQSCAPVDGRFEPISLWTDENWHRFRFLFQIDSRDLMMLGDPYAALMTVLFPTKAEAEKYPALPRHGTYDPSTLEFMGSTAEDFTVGGSSWPHGAVSFWAHTWTAGPCGESCFQQMAQSSYTNGEPFAVVNTGNMVGTGLGMRDYLRTHLALHEASRLSCHADQGYFTIFIYGLVQPAGYPHRVLILSSSYSGFANGIHNHHSTKEHTLNTCDGRPVAILHQGDRWGHEWGYNQHHPAIQAMLPKIR